MDPLNRTIPLKKRQEPRRREGINRRENRIGKPGGGPQAKEDHCREIGKSWQNRNKGPGIQHPLGGRGALVCNHIQNAWDVDRNKENVLLMTTKGKTQEVASQGGERKDPSFANKETTILNVWTNVLPWSESGGTLGK